MKIDARQLNKISFKPDFGKAKKEDSLQTKPENHKKVKSLALALAGLGTVGAATFLILKGKKSCKSNIAQEVKKSVNEVKRNVEEFVYNKNLVAAEIPVDSSLYSFMQHNIKGFYLESGREINKFLRTGELKELPILADDMPAELKNYAMRQIKETKAFNRAVVDSVERLDAKMTSVTDKPMTVFRDAPRSWLDKAENGILTDKAFCSTSTIPGGSLEGFIGPEAHLNVRYEIRLPKGTKFFDLRNEGEFEMLLPRNCKFRIVSGNILELIS